MATFYEDWLETNKRLEKELESAPVVARGRNVKYVETPQDAKVGLIIARQTGFPTQGGAIMQAEIPDGWHTGKHRHGEEAIHILKGQGFAIVDGARYNFKAGTTIHIPYMADHQLFTTGDEPVVYVSAMTADMDFDLKLGRLEQVEEKGANAADVESRFPAEQSQYAADGRRIALHLEDAPNENARRETAHKEHGHGREGDRHGHQAHRHGAVFVLMGGSESASDETNGFKAKAVAMTNIFEEVAMTSSHKHKHTEAMLYVLEGTGYSEVDGQRHDWAAGDAVHVPPRMTVHEHFNASGARTRTLRVEFGIRYFYEDLWRGIHKVEIREHTQALQAGATPVATPHKH